MRSLDELAEAGFCVDEWDRWCQGQCGTYALGLIRMKPELRLGVMGEMEDEEFFVYDASGRHPLPYHGAHGHYPDLELDQEEPNDYNFAYEESGPEGEEVNLAVAEDHARRNGILEGRYHP